MSKGIDYSKWDHFEDSDDDEDDETDAIARPRVTRLDQPGRVTINSAKNEISIEEQHPIPPQAPVQNESRPEMVDSKSSSSSFPPEHWVVKGGVTRAGETELYWSQDRLTVTIRLKLTTNGKYRCHVSNMIQYVDRFTAVGTANTQHLSVTCSESNNNSLTFEGDLSYPVYLPEDEDGVDWTIEGLQDQKFMSILLYKASPMAGLTLWWKKPLKECENEVDLSDIQMNNAFAKVWKQAHEQFQENVKDKKKYTVE